MARKIKIDNAILKRQAFKKKPRVDAPILVLPGGQTTIHDRSSSAFANPAQNLNAEELRLHVAGDSIFESAFVRGPSTINPGLGPTFNDNFYRSYY